ncbi:hypothetical protein [Streptomyces olivochromogenes]|uniref:hypothetical protein n=1 Tax=Streptomyces olivochromogenes TaxID=1963 RepID=UPI001F399BFB|nr:hypothetical protein [Streptomyces olivochromogenes]MCF3132071.1 hypothetical protein [Streptomyces olivochromogenes]
MFWALDAYSGGATRPTEARIRAVRHPLPFGAVGAVFSGGMCALTIGRLDWQVVLFGLVLGMLVGLVIVFERKRLEHYGFRPEAASNGREHDGDAEGAR